MSDGGNEVFNFSREYQLKDGEATNQERAPDGRVTRGHKAKEKTKLSHMNYLGLLGAIKQKNRWYKQNNFRVGV